MKIADYIFNYFEIEENIKIRGFTVKSYIASSIIH